MNLRAVLRLRLLAAAAGLLLLVGLLAAATFYRRLQASLPQLDGTVARTGVQAPVTVVRDALGVPTIRGADRADVARALGWLHAQERFFQMDLLRRSAAGELAELFGERALPRDRAHRLHRFRAVARAALAEAAPAHRALLDAYTAGVNAGLAALGARPFEYLVLRTAPAPWQPEDSFLVVHAMWLDLQDEKGVHERSLMTLRDVHGEAALAFFAPLLTPDDAALDGTTAPLPAMPGPRAIDLRTRKTAARPAARPDLPAPGSNAFALAGAHTASGAALLASDMHLDLGLPNTWYRAVLETGGRRIVGVTLPGTPAVVVGSNGDVAWAFTAAYIDPLDLAEVGVNSISPRLYTAPGRDGLIEMETVRETLRVKGGEPVVLEFESTIWGPVVGFDDHRRPLALRWIAHDPAATNLVLLDLETAGTVDAALGVVHRLGVPHLNALLADRTGDIAWTIAGRLPHRRGYDGRLPVSWSFGDRGWRGELPATEIPVVRGSEAVRPGRLWSANHRHVGGGALARLGDGAYRRAARAAQIRDALAGLERARPADLLALQLDDRALFLGRWQARLVAALSSDAVAGRSDRAALRDAVARWEGRAATDSASYRLVRDFRLAVAARVFGPLFEPCVAVYPEFDWRGFQYEPALWTLLEQRPPHLLPAPHATWDDLVLAAVDDVLAQLDREGVAPAEAVWGAHNTARLRHPFSHAFPLVGRWLDPKPVPLPGGDDLPRVQSRSHGASERLVVSPGREDEGLFHMPGGQSGHPLSPFYHAGHTAWVRGEPTPLLPGPARHTLVLTP